MAFPFQNAWGKVIGGLLGLGMGGSWGAAVGVIVGHMYDTRQDSGVGFWSNSRSFTATIEESVFTMGVIVLGAKMAKADGRVTRAEIEAFKRVFQIAPAQEATVGHLFDRAKQSADGFEPYALQLANAFRHNPAVLEEILSGLFIIAAADHAGLSFAEITFLKRVAFIFGFGADDFARIAARSGIRYQSREKPQNPLSESYAILGLSETSSAEETKTAYRALIRKHHPDKLMAQGMPPEFVATATEKMKRINAAYDAVCKAKGIR